MTHQLKHFDNLDVLVRQGSTSDAVILLHGFGANAHDLAPLADWLDPQGLKNWYFPGGILRLPLGPFYEARAWAMFDLREADVALKSGNFRAWLETQAHQIEKPSQVIGRFAERLAEQHKKIWIGGFSQGAMVALDAALATPLEWAGLVLLSTTFATPTRWENFLKNEKRHFKILQSHGTQDLILPFSEADALSQKLASFGHAIEFHTFNGGHEIPESVLQAIQKFLS